MESSGLRICTACRSIFLRSRQGQTWCWQRNKKRAAGRECPQWPEALYHAGAGGLCPEHEHLQKTGLSDVYENRSLALAVLGFKDYRAYLASKLWRAIRARAFSLFGRECFWCGEDAEQVHHSEYTTEVLRGAKMEALYPICATCHRVAEFYPDGTKVKPKQTLERLKTSRGHYSIGFRERRQRRHLALVELGERKAS